MLDSLRKRTRKNITYTREKFDLTKISKSKAKTLLTTLIQVIGGPEIALNLRAEKNTRQHMKQKTVGIYYKQVQNTNEKVKTDENLNF